MWRKCVGDENATSSRGVGVDGPDDGARRDTDDAGDEKERTSATGSLLKCTRHRLLAFLIYAELLVDEGEGRVRWLGW